MNSTTGSIAAGALCAAAGTFAWGAFVPSAQLFGPTIRHTGDSKTVALTFDDGPNPLITARLLVLLEKYDAKATFFLIGKHVEASPELAKEIVRRGHSIGNHTNTHPSLVFLNAGRIESELMRCDEAITSATGARPRWFRPPYGFRNPWLDKIVRSRGEKMIVMWSAMGRDWKMQPPERMIRRLRGVRGGDIVLLHDGDHRAPESDRMHTVAALAYWLPRWRDQGLRFVNLDGAIERGRSG